MPEDSPVVTKFSDLCAEAINICAEHNLDHREMARALAMFADGLARLPSIQDDIAIDVDDSSGRLLVQVSREA